MDHPPITKEFPTLHFDQPWQLLRPTPDNNPESSIGFDENLLQRVGLGELGPCLCINHVPQCLVVTRREARMENFVRASQSLAAAGWPVVMRSSGGSCVPQGPGMLNLSIIHPRIKNWSLDNGYQLLCHLMGQLLRSYGLKVETGEVPGSFCDGRYNLQVDGKKLVGTAQRWAGSNRKQAAILTQACLLIDPDLTEATGRLNQFYRLCNNPRQFEPKACTTLRDLRVRPAQSDSAALITAVEQRLVTLLREAFGISTASL